MYMYHLTEHLIHAGSMKRQAHINFVSLCTGSGLFLAGIGCILIKALFECAANTDGSLHEIFFLLPISALFLFCSFLTFAITGVRNTIALLTVQTSTERKTYLRMVAVCAAAVLFCISLVLFLAASNSDAHTLGASLVCLSASAASGVCAVASRRRAEHE